MLAEINSTCSLTKKTELVARELALLPIYILKQQLKLSFWLGLLTSEKIVLTSGISGVKYSKPSIQSLVAPKLSIVLTTHILPLSLDSLPSFRPHLCACLLEPNFLIISVSAKAFEIILK